MWSSAVRLWFAVAYLVAESVRGEINTPDRHKAFSTVFWTMIRSPPKSEEVMMTPFLKKYRIVNDRLREESVEELMLIQKWLLELYTSVSIKGNSKSNNYQKSSSV
jgi:hypothetical protein